MPKSFHLFSQGCTFTSVKSQLKQYKNRQLSIWPLFLILFLIFYLCRLSQQNSRQQRMQQRWSKLRGEIDSLPSRNRVSSPAVKPWCETWRKWKSEIIFNKQFLCHLIRPESVPLFAYVQWNHKNWTFW